MSTGAHLNIRKASPAQVRALSKLTNGWLSSYELGESLNVLDALVKRQEAEIRYLPGSTAFPGTCIEYRLKS